MKKLLYVLFTLTLSACGVPEHKFFYITPELAPQYNSFLQEAADRGNHLDIDNLNVVIEDIVQDRPGYRVLAYCRISLTPVVVIDKNYFKTADPYRLNETFFHELGHCVLNLDHNDDTGEYFSEALQYLFKKVPTSIMNSLSVSHNQYVSKELFEELLPSYLDQLFGLRSSALKADFSPQAKILKSDEMIVYTSKTTSMGCVSNQSVEQIESERDILYRKE